MCRALPVSRKEGEQSAPIFTFNHQNSSCLVLDTVRRTVTRVRRCISSVNSTVRPFWGAVFVPCVASKPGY